MKTETKKYDLDEAGFVFLGGDSRPYWCALYHGNPWLMYWHPDHRWVTIRAISDSEEIVKYRLLAMTDDHAQLYHDQHERTF